MTSQDNSRDDGLQFETELEEHLYERLSDVFSLIDEGLLVRDISKDAAPDWAMTQMVFVRRLALAQKALDKARKERGGKADV